MALYLIAVGIVVGFALPDLIRTWRRIAIKRKILKDLVYGKKEK